jgi:hypothetical protein
MKTSRLVALAFTAGTICAAPAWASTIFVTAASPDGWTFDNTDNSGHNASGDFEVGPGAPPLGAGSAQLVVGDATSSERIYDVFGSAITVGDLSALSYYSYVTTSTAGSGSAPTLQFDLFEGQAYEGRLVFDPGLLLSTVDGTWQQWNAATADAWYFSKTSLGTCLIGGSYCTLSQAANVLDADGISLVDVMFKAGSGQASFNGNVDDFVLNDTTYDFEAAATVPEPADLAIFGSALALLGGMAFYRRRKV